MKLSSKITVGADPELFCKKDGRIIGSEKIIPVDGIHSQYGDAVRDGVQIELHPTESTSITYPVYGIAGALKALTTKLQEKAHEGVSLCFDGVVKVTKEELMALSQESRVLGCLPSENVYGLKEIKVDPMKYLFRSGGGHVHLGLCPILLDYRQKHVPILDALLGIPCVLIDRDPAQAERRKLYGRAGEYRTPPYGVEYRTLSNFWLHSPLLAELVLGQAKVATGVILATVSGEQNLERELLDKLDFRKMIRAIQTNSADLAWEVWRDTVKPFIVKNCTSDGYGYSFPLNDKNISMFEKFAEDVGKNGLKVLGADPLENWAKTNTGSYYGGTFTAHLTAKYGGK